MPGALTPTVHQLKIGLQGAAPPLWRRIQVPSAASLGIMHDVIQEAFGWDSYHLHRFQDGGRRAAAAAEDIGGIWGLEEVVYLVTHPEADPPEHFRDLVCHLREKGYDPGAFDPAELTARLSGLTVRTATKAPRTRNRTRRRTQRLTSEDLEFCTCGRCQAG